MRYFDHLVPIFPGQNDQPRPPVPTLAGNGADLIARYNHLIQQLSADLDILFQIKQVSSKTFRHDSHQNLGPLTILPGKTLVISSTSNTLSFIIPEIPTPEDGDTWQASEPPIELSWICSTEDQEVEFKFVDTSGSYSIEAIWIEGSSSDTWRSSPILLKGSGHLIASAEYVNDYRHIWHCLLFRPGGL